ncbi:hypothetical protein [Aeromonas caviae]|uniref:hypothetical protein n=1 Tax=Aeromonas caviae TaxID=648 RepID=UPI003F7465DE
MSNAATPRRAFGLIWRCAALVGRIHPLKVRKRIQKGPLLAKWPFPNVWLGESESIVHIVDFKQLILIHYEGGVAIGVTGE